MASAPATEGLNMFRSKFQIPITHYFQRLRCISSHNQNTRGIGITALNYVTILIHFLKKRISGC